MVRQTDRHTKSRNVERSSQNIDSLLSVNKMFSLSLQIFIFLCPPRFCLIHWKIPYCWQGYHILLESIFWLGDIYRFYSQKLFLRLKHCTVYQYYVYIILCLYKYVTPIFTNVVFLYYQTIFDEQALLQKRKRLTKWFHKMNKLENSTLTNNACHLPKFN